MFVDRFDQLRANKGISVATASREIGFNDSLHGYWRKKKAQGVDALPNSELACRIADYFGVSVEWLLYEKEEPIESISDEQLQSAILGNALKLTKEQLEEVRRFAQYVIARDSEAD